MSQVLGFVFFVSARLAFGACGATNFMPVGPYVPPGTTHNAYYLSDPAGQQTAVFDLVWGGALASLKQNGIERIWGRGTLRRCVNELKAA